MRAIRWFLGLIFALFALAVVAIAIAWWWAGTEGSAQWALQQVARRQPLVAEGVRGSLRGGTQVARLAWRRDGLAVEAREVALVWRPIALLQGGLHVQRLTAAHVRVEDRRPDTGQRLQPPDSLALRLQVRVDEAEVGRLEWSGRASFEFQELAAGYTYDHSDHRVALRNLRMLGGHYRGELRLGAGEPFTLNAQLEGRIAAPVPGGPQPVPLVFEARADGELRSMQAQARLEGEPGAGAVSGARADVTAQVTPFAEQPVPRARARLETLDIAALWPQAPHTLLTGELALQPQGANAWAVSADLRNALPGPWDRRRVPAERVRLEGDWRLPNRVLVRSLDGRVGGGRVQAQGAWEGEDAWRVEGTLAGVDPAALHSTLASVPLSGRARVRGEGTAIEFETSLEAVGPTGRPAGSVEAAVEALELRSLQARGRWQGEALSLPLLVVHTSDARVDAAIDVRPAARSGRGRIDLEAPGLRVRAVGSLAQANGGGNARVTATSVAEAQQWLTRIPGMPAFVRDTPLAGQGELQLAWQGGWEDPTVEATLTLPLLQPPSQPNVPAPWALRDVTARVDGRLADARVELKGQGLMGARDAVVELSGRAGQRGRSAWQAQVASLAVVLRDRNLGPGPWRLALRRPVDASWKAGRLDVGPGEAALTPPAQPGAKALAPALVAWEPLLWDDGQLRTAGTLSGLTLAWVELLGGPQLAGTALTGDLVFDARWEAAVGDTLRARAMLVRRSGDVSVLAESAEGAAGRVQAGVRDARVTVDAEGESIALGFRWDSERAGTAEGRVSSRLLREGGAWTWPEAAPLSGSVRAQLPRLGVWSLLAPPGWRLRGSLAADVSVAGTRADPQLSGALRADDLALRSVVDGVALQDGRLRARLDGRRLLVDEFVLRGAGASGGSLVGTGEGSWLQNGPQVRVSARLDHLRASARADRELVLSGQVTARMDADAAEVRGSVRVDRARIVLPDEPAPRLGDDVVVRNLPPGVSLGREGRKGAGERNQGDGRALTLAVSLDLGNDFRVQGRGIETRLAGALVVGGDSLTEPRLIGAIRTLGGEYRAYGQRLEIERGVLRFTGPADNPALDVLAIRPRLTQRVGVQVTGTAQAPFVRLYSEPELSEAEKLSWLVLGRPAASGGADTALLQSAALALLQNRTGRGGSGGPAALLGLDELGFRREGAEGPAVTLGKRLGRNLYASYERSLSGTLGTLYVFYDLSQRLTVRAQAGERAAVDLIFTFAYD